ncbi:biotin--[acetyl-CoA-carboxylase] ligase [Thermodesulfitimonas sp.]
MSLREKLLSRLLGAAGFISGAELSSALGVSRCAVWKHIKALREDGFEIAGSPRRGYRLLKVPDALYPPLFLPLVQGNFGRPYYFYPVVSSTNDIAKELARQGAPEGTLVVAEEQTGGRGRLGRAWHSPPGGLWFSLILRPPVSPAATQSLPVLLSLAVSDGLAAFPLPPVEVKWPNDIMYQGKKVGGILVELGAEAEAVHFVVAGGGLNVNITSFPAPLQKTATSLQKLAGEALSRPQLLSTILTAAERYYSRWCREGFAPFREDYERRLCLLGREVEICFGGSVTRGTVVGVDPEGHLVLASPDGTKRRFVGGEVTLKQKPWLSERGNGEDKAEA